MAAFIFDIDGTLVKYHTNEWLPGAKEMLVRLFCDGNQLIFTTMRGSHDAGKEWSVENTNILLESLMQEFQLKFRVLYGVAGGRTLVDDDKRSRFVHHSQNKSWDEKDLG